MAPLPADKTKREPSAVCIDNHIARVGLAVIGGGNIVVEFNVGTGNCKSASSKAGNTNRNIIAINDSNIVGASSWSG